MRPLQRNEHKRLCSTSGKSSKYECSPHTSFVELTRTKLFSYISNRDGHVFEPVRSLAEASKDQILQSFPFHLGATINVPTSEARYQPQANAMPMAEAPKRDSPFAGLPLQAWAERLGERIMPAYELIKEEQKKSKLAAKPAVETPPTYAVPHLFPITRWYVERLSAAYLDSCRKAMRCNEQEDLVWQA